MAVSTQGPSASGSSQPRRASGTDRPAPAYVTAEHAALADAALVALLGRGDGKALEALYGRYVRPCTSLSRRLLGDERLAQDVVQEVFLALWRAPERFDPTRGAFASWLLAMTHHKAVDSVRREENLRKRRTTADALDSRPAEAPGVDDQVWSTVRRERVREALQTLPPVQREALALAYFGGYTQREIAGLTATPLGTVKTRMLAGMRRLKGSLDGMSNAAEPTLEPSVGPVPDSGPAR